MPVEVSDAATLYLLVSFHLINGERSLCSTYIFTDDRSFLPTLQGLAVLTVFKAGFIGSARGGSGIITARLQDGQWSAPSAICTVGGGIGGQVGLELTDFVFILNDYDAVRTFSRQGSVTLGGNVSLAAGPLGRNAEAAGAASTGGVAGVFSYSRTRGLFAGVSLEGSVLVERREANEKLYRSRVSAQQLLEGAIPPPEASEPLMAILQSRAFNDGRTDPSSYSMYNDMPVYDSARDDLVWEGRTSEAYGEGRRPRPNTFSEDRRYGSNGWGGARNAPYRGRSSTWAEPDDDYGRGSQHNHNDFSPPSSRLHRGSDYLGSSITSSDLRQFTGGKPVYGSANRGSQNVRPDEAIALYNFDAVEEDDLGFRKGEVIKILKRTDTTDDWWRGRITTPTGKHREGMFPAYVSTLSAYCFFLGKNRLLTLILTGITCLLVERNEPGKPRSSPLSPSFNNYLYISV